MKVEQCKVWSTDDGRALLRITDSRCEVIPCLVDIVELRELGRACADAANYLYSLAPHPAPALPLVEAVEGDF